MSNILKNFYEWPKWEGFMHNLLCILIIYSIYLFISNKENMTLTNILLFTIVVGIDTLIHHHINKKNKSKTEYI